DGKPFAVHPAGVDRGAPSVQPDVDGGLDAPWDADVAGEEVGRACRDDRKPGFRAGSGIDAALDHPVPAPDEDQPGAMRESVRDLLRRLSALVDLEPQRASDAPLAKRAPELVQAAVQALAGVCHDCHGGHFATSARSSATARAVRAANSATSTAPTPINAPAVTSIGWCSPRYIRE